MLHFPPSNLEPSQLAPSTAQPFDAKRYLQRARKLGIMVFPSIFQSGKPHIGYCAYPGYSFGQGHRQLAEEFDDEAAKAVIFDALCEDFDLDRADPDFNDKVNEICHRRSRDSTDGDKRLIELCKRAKAALEKDAAATEHLCDATAIFEDVQPERPVTETPDGSSYTETQSAAEMREKLPGIRAVNHKSVVTAYRQRITKVAAYEKERDRVKRETGLSRAEAAADAAAERAKALVNDVASLPATTLLGMAWKAGLLPLWKDAGYGLDDEGELLAYSIADDARMLGTGGQVRHRSPATRPRASAEPHPLAQVH